MAEMLIQSESLTAIADKIRVLKGITESMSLEDMETELNVIPKNDSSDLTASGATVTVPAGYYATQATKSVATAAQATPSVSIDSAGLITVTATQTAGYVTAGSKTATKQLAFQAAKTIIPSTTSQIAVPSGVYTTGAVTVAAIPSTNVYETDFVPAVDVIGEETDTYIPIEHNLGVVPNTIIIARKQFSGAVKYENFYSIVTSRCLSNSLLAAQSYHGSSRTQNGEEDIDVDTEVDFTIGSFNNSEKTSVINVTETSLNIVGQLGSGKARLKAGITYHLVVIA